MFNNVLNVQKVISRKMEKNTEMCLSVYQIDTITSEFGKKFQIIFKHNFLTVYILTGIHLKLDNFKYLLNLKV